MTNGLCSGHRLFALCFAVVLTPLPAAATTIHSHCFVQSWGKTTFFDGDLFGGLIATGSFTVSGGAMVVPLYTAAGVPDDCDYERISDVTEIDIRIDMFGGVTEFVPTKVTLNGQSPLQSVLTFTDGVTNIFTWNPHPEPGAVQLNVEAPGGSGLVFELVAPEMYIKHLTISGKGHHYFVPEPTTLTLLALAGVAFFRKRAVGTVF